MYVPAVHAPEPEIQVWHPPPSTYWGRKRERHFLTQYLSKPTTLLHPIVSAMVTQFPHPRLIQYDCGKWWLQFLLSLLIIITIICHRKIADTRQTPQKTKARKSQGSGFYSNDKDARCFGSFSEFPRSHLFKTGRDNKGGPETNFNGKVQW